jgi:hypothetical protein
MVADLGHHTRAGFLVVLRMPVEMSHTSRTRFAVIQYRPSAVNAPTCPQSVRNAFPEGNSQVVKARWSTAPV